MIMLAFSDVECIIRTDRQGGANSLPTLTTRLNEVSEWLITIYPFFISEAIPKPLLPLPPLRVLPANNPHQREEEGEP